jgi:glycosyltransferase involved in cell wall biosynthesis
MSGRALGRAASQRFLARLDLEQVIVPDEAVERPWEILRGLDAVLLLGPAPSRRAAGLSALPLLWAFAANVPVIAEASAPTAGLLVHDQTGLAFAHGDLNAACERLARLHDDRALADRLASQARRRIVERHDPEVLCRQLQAAYHRAIERGRDEYVEIAPDP